jgi:urea transporter
MSVMGADILPGVAPDETPFWRQCLRGFSQCAFQCNEITGLAFIVAVAVHSWRMAVFYVIGVILGTLVARLLGGDRTLLGLGLFGFNSGLMGLALGNFFVADTALWIAVPILACIVGAVTIAMAKWLPIPFLAAPFIATFWVLWPVKSSIGLTAINLGAFGNSHVRFILATFSALGSALFAASAISGLLFLLGILIANWRHAVIAAVGALVAALLAAHVGAAGDMINSGFIGFNAVLAAIATYELVAADLRLVLLAAMTSTWIFSFINRTWPSPALASGFVLTVWGIMLLGWLNPRFRPEPAPSEPEAPVPVPASGDAPS